MPWVALGVFFALTLRRSKALAVWLVTISLDGHALARPEFRGKEVPISDTAPEGEDLEGFMREF